MSGTHICVKTGTTGSSSGGSSFVNTDGWVQLNDDQYTQSSPLNLTPGTRTKITNNKAVILDPYSFPYGDSIFDSTTNKITVNNEGDAYGLRIDYDAFVVMNNQFLKWEIDIGGSQGSILTIPDEQIISGAGERPERFVWMPFYQLGTFAANGGDIFVTASGLLDIYNIRFVFFKLNDGSR